MIERLGGVVCNDPSQCSHLIAEKIVRTPNFLTAINYCSYITSAEWVVESAKSGHFVGKSSGQTIDNRENGGFSLIHKSRYIHIYKFIYGCVPSCNWHTVLWKISFEWYHCSLTRIMGAIRIGLGVPPQSSKKAVYPLVVTSVYNLIMFVCWGDRHESTAAIYHQMWRSTQ